MVPQRKAASGDSVLVSQDATMFEDVVQRRMPRVLVSNYHLGGSSELSALEESGELDTLHTARWWSGFY